MGDLYSQCFDELIRQMGINCPERGLLLLRVRDEIRMTIDAYKTLYESSVTFGVRKQLQAEQGMPELEAQVKELETQKKQKEEIEFLKYQSEHLGSFLKTVNAKAGLKS